jgi:hypothetical protein
MGMVEKEKIKKVKEIPPKVKEIKEEGSRLEEEISESEEEKFEEFMSGTSEEAPVPIIRQEAPRETQVAPRVREIRTETGETRQNPYEDRQTLYAEQGQARSYNLSAQRLPGERQEVRSSLETRPTSMLMNRPSISPDDQRIELVSPERSEGYQTEFDKQRTKKRYPWEV